MAEDTDTTDHDDDTGEQAEQWTAPEGHTTLLAEEIRDAANGPMVWDESLPADGIVESPAPGEVIFSMVHDDPQHQDPGAVLEVSTEVPAAEPQPAKKAPAKKAPAKKAPAKKAAPARSKTAK